MHAPQLFMAALSLTGTIFATSVMADAPDPGSVTIAGLSHRGPGCPQGSVAYNLSPDAKAFTVLFDNFIVETGEQNRRDQKRCDINLEMNVPSGWSFAFFCVEFRGFADLEEGLVGQQTSRFRYAHGRPQQLGQLTLEGPFSDDYQKVEQLPLSAYAWAPCGGSATKRLVLETDIAIQPKRGQFRPHPRDWRDRGGRGGDRGNNEPKLGLMTVDSVDGELKHHYGIAWKRCENDRGGWHRDRGRGNLRGWGN